jgi:GntR family transcriptional regulator/MocR family aminotransferase
LAKTSPEIALPGLRVNRRSSVPAYRQLCQGIQNLIVKGQLRPHDRMPSSRVLAKELGLSRNVVLLAYEQLTLEGYLVGVVGSGSYVAENIGELLATPKLPKAFKKPTAAVKKPEVLFQYPLSDPFIKRESSKSAITPFANPIPALDEFPYKSWVKSAYRAFRAFEFLHLGYDDPQGFLLLRKLIADYLRTNRALQCEADQIVITTGAQQGLHLIANLLLKEGDTFWMEDPGYGNAKAAFMESKATPCFIPITKNGIDVSWAIRYYPNASAVYLTPSHQFPLGGTLPIAKRIQLLNWAGKQKMWIIEDDYDSEFRYSKKPIPSLQGLDQQKQVIYLGTFSKVLFPALRIGYVVLPTNEMATAFSKAKAFLDRQNPITDQAILYEFMKGGFFLRHLRKMRLLYKKRQDCLIQLLNKYGKDLFKTERQNSGMHLIAWLPKNIRDHEVAAFLEKEKIIATPVSLYSEKQKLPPGLILGYTAFNERRLKEYALKLIEATQRYLKSAEK